MGVSGCGKSTLGALLAEAMGCRFLEGDAFHSPDAVEKMRNAQPLTDEDRWPWLDRLAQAAVATAACEGMVVAACSALRKSYRDRLRATIGESTYFLFLENGRADLLARLDSRLDHYMPASLLDSQLATLERPEAAEPAKILRGDIHPAMLRDAALAWLRDRTGRQL
ncbi:gluconokinase [Sphingobium sp. SCG-1]|uniref:gluconokinase n=1 Tax=Sphingobium sp. SCG-1 TaxID=2072936 RepID=UPI00166FDDDA